MSDGVIFRELDGTIIAANKAMANLTGYSIQYLQGMNISKFVTPDSLALVREKQRSQLEKGTSSQRYEFTLVRNDGTKIIGESVATLVVERGSPVGVLATFRDITERKRMEEELLRHRDHLEELVAEREAALKEKGETLRRSEEQYRRIVETAQEGICIVDEGGKMVFVNNRFAEMLGYAPEEIVGKLSYDVTVKAEPSKLSGQFENRRHDGADQFDLKLRRKDGSEIWVMVSGSPIYDSGGKYSGNLGMFSDITERKKLDALKDEIIGLVSHEIRTPLTVIMGALNTVLSEKLNIPAAEERQLLQDAAEETDLLSHIVENIIDLSQAQAGRMSVNAEPVVVRTVVKKVVQKLQRKAPIHRFVIDFPPRLPVVPADQIRLERILYNLVDNAIKYSPEGGEIRISARRNTDCLEVSISDQGIGISSNDQLRLFSAFERLQDVEGIKGVGLGLMVCRRLVEAHGGRIWVESKWGCGSTFPFSLPLNKKRKSSRLHSS